MEYPGLRIVQMKASLEMEHPSRLCLLEYYCAATLQEAVSPTALVHHGVLHHQARLSLRWEISELL